MTLMESVLPVLAAFDTPVAPVSEDSLAEREAARSGVRATEASAKTGTPSALERAYSVAAAAGLIQVGLFTPALTAASTPTHARHAWYLAFCVYVV